MWRVLFDSGEALHVEAQDAESAAIVARLQAWSVTGLWLAVREVCRA